MFLYSIQRIFPTKFFFTQDNHAKRQKKKKECIRYACETINYYTPKQNCVPNYENFWTVWNLFIMTKQKNNFLIVRKPIMLSAMWKHSTSSFLDVLMRTTGYITIQLGSPSVQDVWPLILQPSGVVGSLEVFSSVI